jgi:hypothetical protein
MLLRRPVMKKNKLFIIVIITIAVLIFTTAQICNQCGITPAQETKEDVTDETDTDNTGADTTSRETTAATTATTITGEPEEPTIELQVYMGPEYKAEDDVCYYRVEAVVTGNPMPTEAVFSKDDSGGSWGLLRTQVNLTRDEPDYTLTASVTTSAGTAEDSIDLSWGCDGETEPGPEPDPEGPEPEPVEEVDDIFADVPLSGMIYYDWIANQGDDPVFVGDTPDDLPVKAYLSFNISHISSLDDVTIKEASVSIPIEMIVDHPELGGPEIHILVFYYEEELTLDDQITGGVRVKEIATSDSLTNLDFTSSELEDELQSAVDTGLEWFQLKISPTGINENGIWDYYMIPTSSTVLHITYEIPG